MTSSDFADIKRAYTAVEDAMALTAPHLVHNSLQVASMSLKRIIDTYKTLDVSYLKSMT